MIFLPVWDDLRARTTVWAEIKRRVTVPLVSCHISNRRVYIEISGRVFEAAKNVVGDHRTISQLYFLHVCGGNDTILKSMDHFLLCVLARCDRWSLFCAYIPSIDQGIAGQSTQILIGNGHNCRIIRHRHRRLYSDINP